MWSIFSSLVHESTIHLKFLGRLSSCINFLNLRKYNWDKNYIQLVWSYRKLSFWALDNIFKMIFALLYYTVCCSTSSTRRIILTFTFRPLFQTLLSKYTIFVLTHLFSKYISLARMNVEFIILHSAYSFWAVSAFPRDVIIHPGKRWALEQSTGTRMRLTYTCLGADKFKDITFIYYTNQFGAHMDIILFHFYPFVIT